MLYIVGTPIGNLGDMTARAIETLRSVDFIIAEDTRVTVKLLNHFEISRPMVSYHEHNLREKGEYIIERLLLGENAAIVTDAGMPCISDPGEDLVKLAVAANIEINVIPGPSALIAALAVSGLNSTRFCFEGFLTLSKKRRLDHLKSLEYDTHTLIFYEAPHKLVATLIDILKVLGDRRISIVKEITKIYEGVWRGNISEAIALYQAQETKIRGEFALVVEGYIEDETVSRETISEHDAVEMVRKLSETGISLSDATKQIALETGFKKNVLYKLSV